MMGILVLGVVEFLGAKAQQQLFKRTQRNN